MQINNLFGLVPTIIGNFLSNIYCVSKSDDVVYKLEYTGSTLKIVSKEPYKEIETILNDKTLLAEIETRDKLKKVINNSFIIYTETIEDYKIILISDLKEEINNNQDKYTLLIADDSPVITKFFTKNFENDFNILVAKNGEEAIKLIEENKENKSLVGAFIDLKMPIKSGYDVLEYLSNNNLFDTIPTSVISGEDSQDGIERATGFGIVDMLQKPFNVERARSIVDKTIQHSKNYNR